MSNSTKAMAMPIIVLLAICVVITGALALTNSITEPIIEEAARKAAMEALFKVVPAADDFDEVTGLTLPAGVDQVYTAKNGAGYAILVKGQGGYGGDIVMAVGIDKDGKVIETYAISNNETPSLGGVLVTDPSWTGQFKGMDSSLSGFSVKSGCTVTSNAFKKGVENAFAAFALVK